MKLLLPLLLLSFSLSAADLSEAKALINARKHAEAKPLLEKIVALEPKNVDALYSLGLCELRLRERDAALDHFQAAAELAPTRTDVLLEYGKLAGKLSGKRKSLPLAFKSRNTLERVLEMEPKNSEAREWLIGFYSGAPWIAGGSMKKAFAHAQVLTEQDEAKGFFWHVRLNLQEKRFKNAFQACDQAIKRAPDSYFVRYQFGLCCAQSGERLAQGKELLEANLKMAAPRDNPGHDEVCLQLGLIAKHQGDAAAARGYFERGLKENPKNEDLLKQLN